MSKQNNKNKLFQIQLWFKLKVQFNYIINIVTCAIWHSSCDIIYFYCKHTLNNYKKYIIQY